MRNPQELEAVVERLHAEVTELRRQLEQAQVAEAEHVAQLRAEVLELRAWCTGIEQQQAQLLAAVLLSGRGAGLALSRFPLAALGVALPDELAVHGGE